MFQKFRMREAYLLRRPDPMQFGVNNLTRQPLAPTPARTWSMGGYGAADRRGVIAVGGTIVPLQIIEAAVPCKDDDLKSSNGIATS